MGIRSVGSLLACTKNSVSPEQGAQNPQFDIGALEHGSRLNKLEIIGDKQTSEGLIRRVGFVTLAGHAYSAFIGIPHEQTTNVPTIGTSAWLTSIQGHNELIARELMAQGNPVYFVGAEGSYHKAFDCGGSIRGISQAKSAAAVLRFSEIAPGLAEKEIQVREKSRFLNGDSRGAMVGMGIVAFDSYFGQHIEYADVTAACFPRRLNILTDTPKLLKFAAQEPISLARLVSHMSGRGIVELLSTADMHPAAIASQLAIAGTLFSGEAGDLARQIQIDRVMHILTYRGDDVSMHGEWNRIFAEHHDVRITGVGGTHMTIADPETLAYLLARNQAVREQFVPGEKLSVANISIRAHELVDNFRTKAWRIGDIALAA